MPKINNYSTPELNAQTNAVESSSGLRGTGEFGKQLQRLGSVVEDVGDMVYRRQAQEETSDLNARFAEARAEWAQNLEEETRNGTIDAAKTSEKVQEYLNGLNQDFTTVEGRRMFEREAARLNGFVLKGAAKGQAQVAGAKAEANWRSALANNSSVLNSDPSDFEDTYQSTMDSIDSQVETGAIPAAIAEKFKLETGRELAKSAVRGWANLNPEIADKKLNSGAFDKYFDGDTKAQMQGYINAQKSAGEIEQRRTEKALEDAKKKTSEAWQNKNLAGLVSGQLPTKDIINSPDLTYDDKVAMLKLQDWATRQETKTDHRVKNELTRQILLSDDDPEKKIHTLSDLAPYVGKGLNTSDVSQLNGLIDKSPEGKLMREGRRRLTDAAKSVILKKDPMSGLFVTDETSEYNYSTFISELQQAETQMKKDGKPVGGLYDPESNDYFGKRLSKYKLTPQQVVDRKVQIIKRNNSILRPEAPPGSPPGTPPPPTPEMVDVYDENGRPGRIPVANLEKFIKRGGRKQ